MSPQPSDIVVMTELEPAELLRRCEAGERWQLLDVREPWELENVRTEDSTDLPVAVIPMDEIPDRMQELESSRPVAVLCHSGVRSARVAQFLAEKGFAQVANVRGGIVAWPTDRLLHGRDPGT